MATHTFFSVAQEIMDGELHSKKEGYIMNRILKQFDKLLSTHKPKAKLDQEFLFESAIKIANMMRENGLFNECYVALKWVTNTCHKIEDPLRRLWIIKRCGRAIWSVGIAMKRRRQDFSFEIIKYAIPTLKSLLSLIDKTGATNVEELAHAQAWCCYYTAACHQYAKKYSSVCHYSHTSISLMRDTFGDDYIKFRVVGLSHAITAEAWKSMKGYHYAISEYKKAKKVFESAKDIRNEIHRMSCINYEESKIKGLEQNEFFTSLRKQKHDKKESKGEDEKSKNETTQV